VPVAAVGETVAVRVMLVPVVVEVLEALRVVVVEVLLEEPQPIHSSTARTNIPARVINNMARLNMAISSV
jgi:hypothetical protein